MVESHTLGILTMSVGFEFALSGGSFFLGLYHSSAIQVIIHVRATNQRRQQCPFLCLKVKARRMETCIAKSFVVATFCLCRCAELLIRIRAGTPTLSPGIHLSGVLYLIVSGTFPAEMASIILSARLTRASGLQKYEPYGGYHPTCVTSVTSSG